MVLSILARCRGNFTADDDIAFSDAIVNVGRIFKGNDASKVIIPARGVYYITFGALWTSVNVTATLFVNGSKHVDIIAFSYYLSVMNQEHNFVLHLTTGKFIFTFNSHKRKATSH